MSIATMPDLPQAPRVLNGCEKQGYEALTEEASYRVDPATIVGEIPADLEGTLFRNGPGRNRIGGQQYSHWFDGDGMISAVTFGGGRVHFKNRYVRTPKYVRETAAQKILYRGVGTQIPGGILRNAFRTPGNAANTSVVLHAGKDAAAEDDGYLASIVYNAEREKSEVVIVDATDLQREVAVVPLRHHIPYGFHGSFCHKTFEQS